jgi:aryl-phospho-beta-D-glucosidase BglC (GH1 family)
VNWGGIIITAVNNCIAAIRDISSMALVKEMKAGWNLGNSLDVNRYLPKSNNPSEYETYWGNPVVKKEIIDNIKNAVILRFRLKKSRFNLEA